MMRLKKLKLPRMAILRHLKINFYRQIQIHHIRRSLSLTEKEKEKERDREKERERQRDREKE